MNINVTVNLDIKDIFNNMSSIDKSRFCDIALEYLDNSELVEVLRDRNCDWNEFGLKEE